MEELEESWDLVRAGRSAKVSTSGEAEVDSDWSLIRGLPEWIYSVHGETYGIDSFALWRYKPVGHRVAVMEGYGPRPQKFWTFKYDKILWAGPKYNPHSSMMIGKTYRASTKNICLTLDEAFERLQKARDKFVANCHDSILAFTQQISERKAAIQDCKESILQAQAMVFDPSILRE